MASRDRFSPEADILVMVLNVCLLVPVSAWPLVSPRKNCFKSMDEWVGVTSNQFDQLGLTGRAGFFEEMPEMRPRRCLGNPERLSHFRHATDFNDREQDTRSGWNWVRSVRL